MASGDMKARLLLDSKDFEKNIKKSKKNVDDFEQSGKKMGANLASQFAKMTAAALSIKTAEKAFTAFINSSQTLSDSFARSVASMSGVVDNFVYSLANADFSSFNDGLGRMIARLGETYDAFDKLANTKMSAKFANTMDEMRYAEAMVTARNKELPIEIRQGAIAEAQGYINSMRSTADKVAADSYAAIKTMFSEKAGVLDSVFSKDILEQTFRLDLSSSNAADRDKIKDDYNRYRKSREEAGYIQPIMRRLFRERYGHDYHWQTADSRITDEYEALRPAAIEISERNIAQIDKSNADVIANYIALIRLNDERLNEVMDTFSAAAATTKTVAERQTALTEQQKAINEEVQKATLTAKKAKEDAVKELEELERLKNFNPQGTIAGIAYADTSKKMPGSIKMLDKNPAQGALDYFTNEQIEQIESMAKSTEEVNTAISMLESSFASLGSTIGGTAGEMFSFVSSTLEAAQAIIPLIGYIQAEMVMRNANATAAAKEAAAKTLSAHAGIPFAGIALGLSAATAIIAMMQSIPKFAEGGIVNSATLGVFGEAGPEAVMPLDKLNEYISPRELRVTGAIKASGKDLVVVLDNYNRVRNG